MLARRGLVAGLHSFFERRPSEPALDIVEPGEITETTFFAGEPPLLQRLVLGIDRDGGISDGTDR